MKRIISLLLTSMLLVLLVGCGSKPESVVTKFCDALKTFDLETASSCFESGSTEIKNPYTEDNEENQDMFTEQAIEYLKKCAEEMTYTVDEIVIDGDRAVVSVTFDYTDAGPVISATLADYISQAFALAFSGADDSMMESLFGTIFMEKVEAISTGTATSTIDFECIKVDGEWKLKDLSEDVQSEITNIISCNLTKTMEAFEANFEESSATESDSFEDASSNDLESVEEYNWHDVPAGQVLELATIKMTITGCEETNELTAEYSEPAIAQEGTKFVVFTVDIENITKNTMEFNSDFPLYDDQDREYKQYSDALWYFDETFTYTELSPNIKKTGTIVYNIPDDAEGYYLVTAKSGTNDAYRLYAQ